MNVDHSVHAAQMKKSRGLEPARRHQRPEPAARRRKSRGLQPARPQAAPLVALAILVLTTTACQTGDWPKWGEWPQVGGTRKEKIEGQPWTILCYESYGENRRFTIDSYADGLRKTKGFEPDEVRVDHKQDVSRLLYGRYGRKVNPRTGRLDIPDRMTRDMARLRELSPRTREPIYPFALATPVPLDEGPDGPPEWNLLNTDAKYSLLIAVFSAVEDRKAVAVEYVRRLRADGDEAYYYHDATRSHVCVGAFRDRDVVRLPNGVLRVKDPDYERYRLKFPYYMLDGEYVAEVKHDAAGRRVVGPKQPTRLVEVPR